VIDMALALQNRRSSSDVGRVDPLTDIERLRSQITALLDGTSDAPDPLAGAFVPMADVEETDDAYVIEIELPGVDRKDIDISVVGRRLLVTGERKERERVGLLRRRTRRVGEFRYEVVVPDDIDGDAVEARLDRGVLTIRVAKATADRRRRIEVK
jgi:HSP20 family protein